MKNKIGIFVDVLREGGGPRGYCYNLYEGLKQISSANLKIKFIHGPDKKISFFRKVINKLRKFLYILYSDVCVIQGFQNPIVAKIAKTFSKKIIYMPHSPTIFADEYKMQCEVTNTEVNKKIYIKNLLDEEYLFNVSDYVFFPVPEAANSYVVKWGNLLKNKKKVYLKSGTIIRKSLKENVYFEHGDAFVVSFIGRYVTHKGFDIFCEAAGKFKENKNIKFISAGNGGLINKAEENGVLNLGFIKDVESLIMDSDVIVIPNRVSYYDLLPIECSSFGAPLIFSDIGGNISQNKDMPDSLLFHSGDINDLCAVIKKAFEIRENDVSWGSKNKVAYNNLFTETKLAERWVKALSLVVEDSVKNDIQIE